MRILQIAAAIATLGLACADTVVLKDGRVINGNYLGGTPRQVRIDTGDRVETLDVGKVARIEFGSPEVAAAPAPPPPPPAPVRNEPPARVERPNVFRPEPPPAAPVASSARSSLELPAGTNIVIRMIDGVDSEVNRVGQTFQASLDEPVVVGGETAIARGADVIVKLVDEKQSGKLTGRTELTLDLVSIRVDGRMVDINTQSVSQASESRTGRTAKVAGGTAALGAIIGAIAGGGKGAAIGAGAGAAAGAGAQVITKGQKVKIPSETRLTFALETAVRI
jgi:hypothetical protein